MERKTFSYLFIAYIVALAYYMYFHNDKIAAMIIGGGIQGTLIYLFSNPSNVLIVVGIVMFNKGVDTNVAKNVLGGIMIVLAADILGWSRFSPSGLPTDVGLLASPDGIVITKLVEFMSYQNAYFIYYLIIPVLLVLGALALLGINNFFKTITNRGG